MSKYIDTKKFLDYLLNEIDNIQPYDESNQFMAGMEYEAIHILNLIKSGYFCATSKTNNNS